MKNSKILSVLLALAIILSLFPAGALAEGTDSSPADSTVIDTDSTAMDVHSTPTDADDTPMADDDTSAGADSGAADSDIHTGSGTRSDPFTTPEAYSAAVEGGEWDGRDVYLTVSGGVFTPQQPFVLPALGDRANPPRLHLIVTGASFTGSTAGDGAPSAQLSLSNCQQLVLDGCTFDAGPAAPDYGILVSLQGIEGADLSITDCVFTGGYAQAAVGLSQRGGSDGLSPESGALLPASIASVRLSGCTFSQDGGAQIQLGSAAAPSTGAFPATISDNLSPVTVVPAYASGGEQTGMLAPSVSLDAGDTGVNRPDSHGDYGFWKAEASVDGTLFPSLVQAVAEARPGAVVTLTSHVTLSGTLFLKKALTLEGQGKHISSASGFSGAVLLDVSGSGAAIQNVTLNARNVRHAVQFYCVDGGRLREVTVHGGTYTAVMINGSRNILLDSCRLSSGGYTHLEYAMGGSVNSADRIPGFTLRNVTFAPAGETGLPAQIWADYSTVSNLKIALGAGATDDQAAHRIQQSIVNHNDSALTAYVQLGEQASSIRAITLEPQPATAPDGGSDGSGGSGGGSGGSGSGSGDKGETTTHPDGSTTTTVTRPDGSTTQTTVRPDGSQEVVETQTDGTTTTTATDQSGNRTETVARPDGSGQTTVTNQDGSSSTTTVSSSGRVEAQVTLSAPAVDSAAEAGQFVPLPMPQVPVTSLRETAPSVRVALPSGTTARVEIPVDQVTPGTVAILVREDGTHQVLKTTLTTDSGIAVELSDGHTVLVVDNSVDFSDVEAGHWGEQFIDFAASRGLFAGTSAHTFSPDTAMDRAMIVTVLAGYHDVDTAAGSTWYEAGRQWAVENGISDGTNLHDSLTREQLAVMLWRCAGSPAAGQTLSGHPDGDSVSTWARDAMAWAVEQGLISGGDGGALTPQGQATRVQSAAILMRFVEAMHR